jgi:nucleotide-binding universal stress UspA family protein
VKLFSHILCATDFSACAERGVVMALRLSADLGAKLTLLHADDILWMTMGQLAPLNDLKKEGREHIEKNLRELGVRHDLARANIEILEGNIPEQI